MCLLALGSLLTGVFRKLGSDTCPLSPFSSVPGDQECQFLSADDAASKVKKRIVYEMTGCIGGSCA